jgi:ATP-dependent DNA helicase PIF1
MHKNKTIKPNNKTNLKKIELNPEFTKALDLMENTSKNIFITGKAGTGKSTLLEYFRNTTKKKIVVLAPTGVAALNVKGQTIHSFFKFKPNITIDKIKKSKKKERDGIYKKLDAIIIDEISMVRADLLDCVDIFLRKNAKPNKKHFGGIQMIFIGDLYQLPPVVTRQEKEFFSKNYKGPYFFNANLFQDFNMEFIELEKIYRQKDEVFIEMLNAIRNNTVTEKHLRKLNTRVGVKVGENNKTNFGIHLTTTNDSAEKINQAELVKLKSKIYEYKADIDGEFEKYSYPTLENLYVSIGAQVMMLNNDSLGRWVNGSIGKIIDIRYHKEIQTDFIIIEFSDGKQEEVLPHTWDVFNFVFNENTNHIDTETAGSFTQYPLKLAWAITIHKSQGKTFDKVIIDVGPTAFAGGQTYVALSRCTSFEGISLIRPIARHHVFVDWRIVKFLTSLQYDISEKKLSLEDKINIIEEAIKNRRKISITYLKNNDDKSKREIIPYEVGEMFYNNIPFLGVSGHCLKRDEERVFKVERILEISIVN